MTNFTISLYVFSMTNIIRVIILTEWQDYSRDESYLTPWSSSKHLRTAVVPGGVYGQHKTWSQITEQKPSGLATSPLSLQWYSKLWFDSITKSFTNSLRFSEPSSTAITVVVVFLSNLFGDHSSIVRRKTVTSRHSFENRSLGTGSRPDTDVRTFATVWY